MFLCMTTTSVSSGEARNGARQDFRSRGAILPQPGRRPGQHGQRGEDQELPVPVTIERNHGFRAQTVRRGLLPAAPGESIEADIELLAILERDVR